MIVLGPGVFPVMSIDAADAVTLIGEAGTDATDGSDDVTVTVCGDDGAAPKFTMIERTSPTGTLRRVGETEASSLMIVPVPFWTLNDVPQQKSRPAEPVIVKRLSPSTVVLPTICNGNDVVNCPAGIAKENPLNEKSRI